MRKIGPKAARRRAWALRAQEARIRRRRIVLATTGGSVALVLGALATIGLASGRDGAECGWTTTRSEMERSLADAGRAIADRRWSEARALLAEVRGKLAEHGGLHEADAPVAADLARSDRALNDARSRRLEESLQPMRDLCAEARRARTDGEWTAADRALTEVRRLAVEIQATDWEHRETYSAEAAQALRWADREAGEIARGREEEGRERERTDEAILGRYGESIVRIGAGDGAGSGFVLAGVGLIVTNAHVVGDETMVEVYFPAAATWQRFSARVIARDAAQDLALLQVQGRVSLPAGFELAHGDAAGHGLVAIGCRGGAFEQSVSRGRAGGWLDTNLGRLMRTTIPVGHGNSGGPVIDLETGRVVGVVVAGREEDQFRALVIPADCVASAVQAIAAQPVPAGADGRVPSHP